MKPFWVTFYSYKGGVGRTMAMANVAALLARKGRKVVMLDFDLEAPGLDSFEEFKPAHEKPGVVEFVQKYQKTKTLPPLENYIFECPLEEAISVNWWRRAGRDTGEVIGELRGRVWLMPAGTKDQRYNHDLAQINWPALYESNESGRFVEAWKKSIEEKYSPDYVLVDSRTGLTDVGGICTGHLADLVVLLSGLNRQNVDGIKKVYETLRGLPPEHAPDLLPVLTPVPTGIFKERKKGEISMAGSGKLTEIASQLGETKTPLTIPYEPYAALYERLYVLTNNFPVLNESYNKLLQAIIEYNPDGVDNLRNQIRSVILTGSERHQLRLCNNLKDTGDTNNSDSEYGIYLLERSLGKRDSAESHALKALRIDPRNSEAFRTLINSCYATNEFRKIADICSDRLSSGKQPPAEHSPKTNCGLSLADQMETYFELAGVNLAMAYQLSQMDKPEANIECQKLLELAKDSILIIEETRKFEDVTLPSGSNYVLQNFIIEAERRQQRSSKEVKLSVSRNELQCNLLDLTFLLRFSTFSYAEAAKVAFGKNKTLQSIIPKDNNLSFQDLQFAYLGFALISEHNYSREALEAVLHKIDKAPKVGEAFSLRQFCPIFLENLKEEISVSLAMLDEKKLWDGMPIESIQLSE
jgi:cellulose biosynthesis protein BcsQ